MTQRPLVLTALLCLSALVPIHGQLLNKDTVLRRQTWWDNKDWDWYKTKIPFFESPDTAIDATYYYRWELITKHLTYGAPETGYTFSEFIDRPFWSGAYGAISCPLGHQAYEIRWLKDRRIIEDFARYWFETAGAEPRSYSNWYGDAMWATYLAVGDTLFVKMVLPHMEAQFRGWVAEHWDSIHAMFRWDGMHDGMETNINSRQTEDVFSGGDGYRPTLNSYLFADAIAIAKSASLLGDSAKAKAYAERAMALKERVQKQLWDPKRQFFFPQFARNEKDGIRAGSLTYQDGPHAGDPHGREEIGFVPWQFNLPDPGYERAWRTLMDPASFFAPFGPTTTERGDPLFKIAPRCCEWSGNSWPYATSQTLVAMANLLNDYHQTVVTPDDYMRLLKVYTLTQRLNGRPYIAEAANPDNGSWDGANTYYHSEHYFHSQYVNLIVTGLAGLRPRGDDSLEVHPLIPAAWDYFALDDVAYRGHRISIAWDRHGTRYHRGKGFMLFVDGKQAARAPRPGRLTILLAPGGALPPVDRPVNLAINNGRGAYPWVFASYSAPESPTSYLIDGQAWYHQSPPNRWTTLGSPNASDWIVLDFGITRSVEQLKLYFLDDSTGVRPPAQYQIEQWRGGKWLPIPNQRRSPSLPTGRRPNLVTFSRIETAKIRVDLTSQTSAATGLTELEAWTHARLPLSPAEAAPRNLAFGRKVSASFAEPDSHLQYLTDGIIAFSYYGRNHWSFTGSPNGQDWVEVNLGAMQSVGRVEAYLWADGRGVRAPKSYTVQYWNGRAWTPAHVRSELPAKPQASAANTILLDPVLTDHLRIVFEHDLPAVTGLTEVMILDGKP